MKSCSTKNGKVQTQLVIYLQLPGNMSNMILYNEITSPHIHVRGVRKMIQTGGRKIT